MAASTRAERALLDSLRAGRPQSRVGVLVAVDGRPTRQRSAMPRTVDPKRAALLRRLRALSH